MEVGTLQDTNLTLLGVFKTKDASTRILSVTFTSLVVHSDKYFKYQITLCIKVYIVA
jgi:hypothetical protein